MKPFNIKENKEIYLNVIGTDGKLLVPFSFLGEYKTISNKLELLELLSEVSLRNKVINVDGKFSLEEKYVFLSPNLFTNENIETMCLNINKLRQVKIYCIVKGNYHIETQQMLCLFGVKYLIVDKSINVYNEQLMQFLSMRGHCKKEDFYLDTKFIGTDLKTVIEGLMDGIYLGSVTDTLEKIKQYKACNNLTMQEYFKYVIEAEPLKLPF